MNCKTCGCPEFCGQHNVSMTDDIRRLLEDVFLHAKNGLNEHSPVIGRVGTYLREDLRRRAEAAAPVRDYAAEALQICWCGHPRGRHIDNSESYYCTDSAGPEGAGVCRCMHFALPVAQYGVSVGGNLPPCPRCGEKGHVICVFADADPPPRPQNTEPGRTPPTPERPERADFQGPLPKLRP